MVANTPDKVPDAPSLLVVGVGNAIREDDGAGFYITARLREQAPPNVTCMDILEPDILLAETISTYDRLIIVDALADQPDVPYQLFPIRPSGRMTPELGFVTHVCDWAFILSVARDIFGNAPDTELLGVTAYSFEFSETVSPECIANADLALAFLQEHIYLC